MNNVCLYVFIECVDVYDYYWDVLCIDLGNVVLNVMKCVVCVGRFEWMVDFMKMG